LRRLPFVNGWPNDGNRCAGLCLTQADFGLLSMRGCMLKQQWIRDKDIFASYYYMQILAISRAFVAVGINPSTADL
jgi:hypothetical protein